MLALLTEEKMQATQYLSEILFVKYAFADITLGVFHCIEHQCKQVTHSV